jgi:hypothetical protein
LLKDALSYSPDPWTHYYPTDIAIAGDYIVEHTATRTATDSGSGTVNKPEGDKDMGTFSSYPQPQQGGTISGVTYSISDNNPNVNTWINGNHVYASTDYSEIQTVPWSGTETGSCSVNATEGDKYITTSTLVAPNDDTTWSVSDNSDHVETWRDTNKLYARVVVKKPTAIIDSITPDPAEQGTDTVSFTGHGTDPDGSVVAYNWRSSIDGQLSTSTSFTKPASELSVGTHTLYFKVQDDDGAWSTEVSEDLTINSANPPPVASFTYSPENPVINERVIFNASDSSQTTNGTSAMETSQTPLER